MSSKTGISANTCKDLPAPYAEVSEQEQVQGLLWSAILASSLAMIVSGCGFAACSLTDDDLAPHYTSVAIGLAFLSLLPLVQKCLSLRRLKNKMEAKNSHKMAAKEADTSWHSARATKFHHNHDDKTLDTRSTCSASMYSSSRRRHRRQTSGHTASTHDSEFLRSIRNQKSVLDCRSHSSDDGEKPFEVPPQETQGAPTEVIVQEPEKPAEEVQTWLDAVVGGSNSSCSSFEESRHPLSPTGYISLVKAFSSHSMGADDEMTDNEEAYWDQEANDGVFEEEDEGIPLNPTVQMSDSSESKHTTTPTGNTTPVKTSARDALSAMLEETIIKMEESSKRMRNVMEDKRQNLLQPNLFTYESRDDLNFAIAASACGTLNLALRTRLEKKKDIQKQEKLLEDPDPMEPVEFSSTPYPLTRSLPRLGTIQMHGGNVRKGWGRAPNAGAQGIDEVRGRAATKNILVQEELREEVSEHDRSVASMMSAPDDEKQQDAQVLIEEDDIVLPYQNSSKVESRQPIKELPQLEDIDLTSITQSLSMSIQRIDLRRGVQCHGGIESVASSE